MFISWGHWLANHRRLVVIMSAASLVLIITAMVTISPNLSSEGFIPESAESADVQAILADDFGMGTDSLVFMIDAGMPVDDPSVERAVNVSLAPIAGDARISAVLTTWSTGNPRMISEDGQTTYAIALLQPRVVLEPDETDQLVDLVTAEAQANGLSVAAGGLPAVNAAIAHQVEEALIRAELVSIPLTIVILLVVFGSAVAAGIPLLVGALAILASLAVIFILSTSGFQSVFGINLITMLGLGLGIDYSLFMVTRFREEITHRPMAEAVAVTMATVGKAIFFSGITVIFGLSATQFFPIPALQSMGQAGIAVTAAAMIFGLTFLPALLALLGTRVNSLNLRRRPVGTEEQESPFWRSVATFVMHRPIQVLVTVLVALLIVSIPLARLDLTPGGPEILPAESNARDVTERLSTDFASDDAEQIPVLVTMDGIDPLSADGVTQLQAVADELGGLDGVARVEGLVNPELAEASAFDWSAYSGDAQSLPAPIADVASQTVRDTQVLFQVSNDVSGPEQEALVRDMREIGAPGVDVAVGGNAASSVDAVDGITDNVVPALVFVLIGSYVILLLTFGSVFLPLKAMFMTLLSISASLGVVVFVFQDGNFQNLLGFEATGEIVSITPVLMFCILFGLSMDYEVLMLSRIQEEYQRTGDNRASVAFGLSRTGRVITGAAAIMVVVFGGFMLAENVIIKSMGFGLALAVLVDATIVRGLLVPATMRLMGRWNWWAPAPVRSLVKRLGLSHSSPSVAVSET